MIEFKAQSQIKDRVYERYLDDRMIILNEDVNEDLIERLVMPIIKFNNKDDEREEKEKDFNRNDKNNIIKVYINSYGGYIHDGLSAVSTMLSSKTPIYTYCLGKAMSMGLTLFIAGQRRFVQRYGTLMYHDAQHYLGYNSVTGHKNTIEEDQRLVKQIDNIITSRTKITQKQLDKYKISHPHEWYIDAETALKYEIAHEII